MRCHIYYYLRVGTLVDFDRYAVYTSRTFVNYSASEKRKRRACAIINVPILPDSYVCYKINRMPLDKDAPRGVEWTFQFISKT